MSRKELELRIKSIADHTGFEEVKGRMGGLVDKAKKAGLAISAGLAIGTAAVVGVGAAAVDAAGTFQTQMKQVETLGADFGRPFSEVEADVSQLATTMGVDAVDAANTLYNAVSAGVPPGNALEFMEAATKAAVGGAANLEDVGAAMSVAMNSWGEAAGSATDITDGLFQVVNMGVTNMPALASSIGDAAGIASAAKVSFNEWGAAIAQITTKGKTTSAASTQLKAIISELMTPTSKSAKVLNEMGFASASAAIESEGLQGVLQLLEQHAADTNVPITALFGSVEAGAGALDLTGANTEGFSEKLAGMENAAGNSEAALAKVNEGWQRQVDLLKSQVSGALRDIGLSLLPSLTEVLKTAAPHVQSLTDSAVVLAERFSGDLKVALDDIMQVFFGVKAPVETTQEAFGEMAAVTVDAGRELGPVGQKVQQLKDKFDEFRPTIERVLTFLSENRETVTKVGVVFGAVATAVGILTPPLLALSSIITIVMPLFSGLASVAGTVAGVLGGGSGLAAAAGTLASVLTGPVGLGIAAVIAGFVLWKAKGDEIKAAASSLADSASQAWTNLQTKTAEAWSAISSAPGAAMDAARSAVTSAQNSIREAVDSAQTAIQSRIAEAQDAIKAKINEVWNAIPEDIRADLQLIASDLQRRYEEWKQQTSETFERVRATIQEKIDQARELVASALAAIESRYQSARDSILSTLADLRDQGAAIVDQVREAIMSRVMPLVEAVRGVFNRAKAVVQSKLAEWRTVAATKAEEVKQSILGPLGRLAGEVGSRALEAKDRLLQPLRDAIASASQIGSDIIAGVAQAIRDGKERLKQAIWDAVRGLLDEAKSRLGIESPSERFREIGQFLMEGLKSGLLDNDLRAVQALTDIVNNMADTAKNGAAFIRSILEFELPPDPQVIKDRFRGMLAILQDVMGEFRALVLDVNRETGVSGGLNLWDIENLKTGVPVYGMVAKEMGGLAASITQINEASEPTPGKIEMLVGVMRQLATVAGDLAGEFGGDERLGFFDRVADAISAAADALEASDASRINEAVALNIQGLANARRNSQILLSEGQLLSSTIQDLEAEARDELVASVEAWADIIGATSETYATAGAESFGDSVEINVVGFGRARRGAQILWQEAQILHSWVSRLADDLRDRLVPDAKLVSEAVGFARDALEAASGKGLETVTRIGVSTWSRLRANAQGMFVFAVDVTAHFRALAKTVQERLAGDAKAVADAVQSALGFASALAQDATEWAKTSDIPIPALETVKRNAIKIVQLVFGIMAALRGEGAGSRAPGIQPPGGGAGIDTVGGAYSAVLQPGDLEGAATFAERLQKLVDLAQAAGGLTQKWSEMTRLMPRHLQLITDNLVGLAESMSEAAAEFARGKTQEDLDAIAAETSSLAATAGPALELVPDLIGASAEIASGKMQATRDQLDAWKQHALMVIDAVLSVVQDVDKEAAEKAALVGNALGEAGGIGDLMGSLESVINSGFFSAARRTRLARTGGEFGELRNLERFKSRVSEAMRGAIEAAQNALDAVDFDAEKATMVDHLAQAYERLADALERSFSVENARNAAAALAILAAAAGAANFPGPGAPPPGGEGPPPSEQGRQPPGGSELPVQPPGGGSQLDSQAMAEIIADAIERAFATAKVEQEINVEAEIDGEKVADAVTKKVRKRMGQDSRKGSAV